MDTEPTTDQNQTHIDHFFLDIEGTVHPWPNDTITTEQIISLGGWPPSEGAIEVFKDNTERTLKPNEVVHIQAGHSFAKKVLFKRG
jgi:hypothetical protein